MSLFTTPRTLLVLLCCLLFSGCASTGSLSEDDPLEPFNRAMYAVHQPIEKVVIRPTVAVYETVTPSVMRKMVSNFFNNIEDLFSGIAGLLQGKLDSAGDDFGRVLVNTTFGLGGIIDFASDANIPRGNQDFGLVLAHWGVGPRPYLFLPLVGPTSVRDIGGAAVNAVWSPVDWFTVPQRNTMWAFRAADSMTSAVHLLDTVDQTALDPYTFIRNAYLQRRAYQSGDESYKKKSDEMNIDDLDELMDESAPEEGDEPKPGKPSESSTLFGVTVAAGEADAPTVQNLAGKEDNPQSTGAVTPEASVPTEMREETNKEHTQ